MARRPTPSAPTRKELTKPELRQGISRLKRLIVDIEAIDPNSFTERYPPEVGTMESRIQETLEKTFGTNSTQFERYSSSVSLYPPSIGMFVLGGETPTVRDFINDFVPQKARALAELKEIIRGFEEELDEELPVLPNETPSATEMAKLVKLLRTPSKKIFIVHGHDSDAKQTVARFVTQLGYDPVILHEQASSGRTIIEKIEANSDVGFAIVLMTPDDFGGKKGEESQPHPRARQNVILELGYFIALLKRSHVFAMTRGNIETPSDFAGVIYHTLDEPGAWKQDLAKEMEAAGLEVDWNKVMRRN